MFRLNLPTGRHDLPNDISCRPSVCVAAHTLRYFSSAMHSANCITFTYMYTRMLVYVGDIMCVCVYIYICLCVCVYIYIYVCMCVWHECRSMYVYVSSFPIYIYTHTHTY